MDKKEYIINEVGLEIARENLAKKMQKTMMNKSKIEEIQQLVIDRDELDKGNINIIRKYVGELESE